MMARQSAHELRRQGRADAVLLAVRKRTVPAMTADDWCIVADVTKADLAKAIARWKWHDRVGKRTYALWLPSPS